MPKYNPNPLFPNEPLFEIHDFSELPKSPRYTLYCNGQEQTVYHTDSFDYAIVVRRDDAPVSVEVCVSDSFKKAVLRPQSLEIPFDREENHIRFSLPYKAKVSLELDNDLKRPLLILSSCYVAPRSKGETYYFRKGQIYNVGNLELKSGESAYLEEGCVVCGRIYSNMADNVRVSGNGILYGGVWHKPDENGGRLMVSFYLGKHILVEGISVVDNGVWNVVPGACRDVIIRDVNIMSRLVTGDGIDIVGCEEVLVEDCFIRACDDCVCIKACALPGPAACCNVRDIKVRRCVLWNAEPGNALEIGYELRCNEVSDVVFEDCDIIHCEYEGNQSGGVLTINDDQCAQIALKLYAWSESALHQTANIVISERINSTEKLMQSVVQIKSIAQQRFLISSPILFADGQTHTQTSPSDNEQQLLEQFEKLCLDYRFSKAREILYTMRREKNFSHLFVKSGISAAAAKLFRILPEISAEQTYQIIESIWRAESMQKLCDILLPILDKAEQKFAETPVKAKKLSDLSKQYIAEHYREDISLQTISESLFISPQHLSSVFKRETGQGLANYLRAYRMKCAKELLKGTRKKVSVICKEVGYPNETYFCKIFRDLYGMSPQQYRDEGTNGKEQL